MADYSHLLMDAAPQAGAGIDYSALNLTSAEQACRESVWLEHQLFLGEASDVDDILEAVEKVRSGADKIRKVREEMGTHA